MPIADASQGIRHMFVRDLMVDARIGVHPHERDATQRVRLNLDLAVAEEGAAPADRLAAVVDYEALVERVRRTVDEEHVQLVETLAEKLAAACFDDPRVRSARVRVEKLDALENVSAVGVEIERLNPRTAPVTA